MHVLNKHVSFTFDIESYLMIEMKSVDPFSYIVTNVDRRNQMEGKASDVNTYE